MEAPLGRAPQKAAAELEEAASTLGLADDAKPRPPLARGLEQVPHREAHGAGRRAQGELASPLGGGDLHRRLDAASDERPHLAKARIALASHLEHLRLPAGQVLGVGQERVDVLGRPLDLELMFVGHPAATQASAFEARRSSACTESSMCSGFVSSSFVCESPRRLWTKSITVGTPPRATSAASWSGPDGRRWDCPATSRMASSAMLTSSSSKRIGWMCQIRSNETSTFSSAAKRSEASLASASIRASVS